MGGIGGGNIYWWIMYDISSPKRLRKMAKLCRQHGLCRIQKSIYIGMLSQEEIMELRENILKWMLATEDRIMMIPAAHRSLRTAITLGDDTVLRDAQENKEVICL
ncbi:MAG TPA: CRISPR-associated endonuclease Cas2 [Lachnospiraceae bacterium]|nr:CRISPR-associated endonuclease Cas2 [Lachnospiraceae bacterium]